MLETKVLTKPLHDIVYSLHTTQDLESSLSTKYWWEYQSIVWAMMLILLSAILLYCANHKEFLSWEKTQKLRIWSYFTSLSPCESNSRSRWTVQCSLDNWGLHETDFLSVSQQSSLYRFGWIFINWTLQNLLEQMIRMFFIIV